LSTLEDFFGLGLGRLFTLVFSVDFSRDASDVFGRVVLGRFETLFSFVRSSLGFRGRRRTSPNIFFGLVFSVRNFISVFDLGIFFKPVLIRDSIFF
jgi:hypothetical protein